jgi:integrase
VVLGSRSALSKTSAKLKLQEIISRYQGVLPDSTVTLRWFIENKFLPLKIPKWKDSTKGTSLGIIQKQITEPLGDLSVCAFDRALLQGHLNSLAEKDYSHSIIQHTKSFLAQIFDEILEADLIQKSPARRLEIPKLNPTRIISPDNALYTGKPFLSEQQLRFLLAVLESRDRLIVMLGCLCAMRPSEIFALTWDAWRDKAIFIMQRVYRRKFDSPKTPASMATIPVPRVVREALAVWKARCPHSGPNSFIFPGKGGKCPLDQYNFSDRVLKLAGIMAIGTAFPVTFQVLRRSFASLLPAYGGDLKAVETILRHSASKSFTLGTYVQPLMEKILQSMDRLADVVAAGLPEHVSVPIEGELFPRPTTQQSASASDGLDSTENKQVKCAEVAELADAPA